MNKLQAIQDYMAKRGVHHYNVLEGNGCLWVSYSRVSMYFYFNGDTIVDVIVD